MTTGNKKIVLNPIGLVKMNEKEGKFWIEIKEKFRPALKELEKFTHVNIFWWANQNDTPKRRSVLISEELPPFYGDAPSLGVFANRSEFRPNPIALTAVEIIKVDIKKGIIQVPWMDAFQDTPVIDMKPYLPATDLIETADYPSYLQHWPRSQEKSAEFWSQQGN